jgi:hypothetical protein
VEIMFIGPISVLGVEEGGDDGKYIRWDREKEGDDVAVAEGLDDGGEEVRYCSRGCKAK